MPVREGLVLVGAEEVAAAASIANVPLSANAKTVWIRESSLGLLPGGKKPVK